jgi:hypothetical protein
MAAYTNIQNFVYQHSNKSYIWKKKHHEKEENYFPQ